MKETTFELTTPYAEKMDKECPWNVYPRPQLKRDSFLCLNGKWDFTVTKGDRTPTEYNEKILVPFPPESALSGINRTIGRGEFLHYRRTFILPEGFKRDRVFIRFGAVDRLALLYINGNEIGSHNDGYMPFSAEITSYLKDGENEIRLKVKDDTSSMHPYGKQRVKRGGMWYTPISGIWQTVWLESTPTNYIKNITVTPGIKEVKIDVNTDAHDIKITLLDENRSFETASHSVIIRPKNVRNWTPEDPYLYYFKVEAGGDIVESYFALRKIGIDMYGDKTRLTLNGEPYLFNGLLDQGYYPDGIFLPATPEGYEEDIKTAKRLGFNTLRKHIKVEPAIFYHMCDKLGIAVFQDMVNNCDYSFVRDTLLPTIGFKRRNDKNLHDNSESREAFTKMMAETINLLHNFPSVLYYTIFNEGWGQFDADEMYVKAKQLDRTRIIDSTSGWFKRNLSDVDSQHIYFKKLPQNTDSVYPLVISEFGGYSHRVQGHLFGTKNYGYKTFEKREDLESAVLSLYENEVLPLVKKGASAFIYTQLSDIEDETNGFLTYDRAVCKISEKKMRDISERMYAAALEFTRNSQKTTAPLSEEEKEIMLKAATDEDNLPTLRDDTVAEQSKPDSPDTKEGC